MNKIKKLLADLCPNGVELKSIGEICQINRGRVMSKDYLRDNSGEYPVYSSQTIDDGVFGRIKTYDYDGEYLTWTTDGANAGSIFYRKGKFSITNVCGLLKVKDTGVNTKFLLYILATVSKKYVNAGMGNPKIMSNVMEKIKIPIPPLAIQQEIVNILDNFTTELKAELEAELEARKKQYEYYRDQLLTFDYE
jgi:type I restriction enzyme S subunit